MQMPQMIIPGEEAQEEQPDASDGLKDWRSRNR